MGLSAVLVGLGASIPDAVVRLYPPHTRISSCAPGSRGLSEEGLLCTQSFAPEASNTEWPRETC